MEIIQEPIPISFLSLNAYLSGVIRMSPSPTLGWCMLSTVVRAAHTSACFLSLLLAFTNAAASANIIFWVCFPDSLVSFAHFSYKADFNIVSAWPFEFYFMFPFLWFCGHPIMTVAKFYNLLDFWQWNCGSHVYSMKLFSYTKWWNPVIWVNMEEPGNYYFIYRKTSTTWSQA